MAHLIGIHMRLRILFLDLSRDSWLGQRNGHTLTVQVGDGGMDGAVERDGVCEGLVSEVVRLEVVPDNLDVVEFGRIFWQPLNGQPVRAGRQGRQREFARVDWTIVLDQDHRLRRVPWLGSVEAVKLLERGR